MPDADILMITYRRPQYVRQSLRDLLDNCPDDARVWVWHNGDDAETLQAVQQLRDHPRFAMFHHSHENVGLREPTNWLWTQADGRFLSKVDDDCLLEPDWLNRLSAALDANPQFGVLGSWRFMPEDFEPKLAEKKLFTSNGHTIMRNHWVQGSGHLFRRDLLAHGPLRPGETFTRWCVRMAQAGYINGWLYPFVREDHMDDPRSPNTIFTSDEKFRELRPLSAYATGVTTLDQWLEQTRGDAHDVQAASLDLRQYTGWRFVRKNAMRRLRRITTGRAPW